MLTVIQSKKTGILIKESDHNVLLTELKNATSNKVDHKKVEVYNIKNKGCQEKFRGYTSHTKMLSSIFDSSDNINILTQKFL